MKSKVKTTIIGKILDIDIFDTTFDLSVAEESMGELPSIGKFKLQKGQVGLQIKLEPYDTDKSIVVQTEEGDDFGDLFIVKLIDESNQHKANLSDFSQLLGEDDIEELTGLINSDTLKQLKDKDVLLTILGGASRDDKRRAVNDINNIIRAIKKNLIKQKSNLKLKDAPFSPFTLDDNFGDVDYSGYKTENAIIIEFGGRLPFFIVIQKRLGIEGNFQYELAIRSKIDQSLSKLSEFISEEELEKLGLGDLKVKGVEGFEEDMLSISFQDDENFVKDLNDFLGAIKNSVGYESNDGVKNNSSLKDLSNDILNIAMLPINERENALSNFKDVVKGDNLLEKEVKKLTVEIVNLLQKETKKKKPKTISSTKEEDELLKELEKLTQEVNLAEVEGFEEVKDDIEDLDKLLN